MGYKRQESQISFPTFVINFETLHKVVAHLATAFLLLVMQWLCNLR